MTESSTTAEYEKNRIRALEEYNILDTAAEQSFDDITQLASLICDTPVSLINFIDEKRQWSKAGAGIDPALTELPREIVFCNQTILNDTLYEISDTTQDPIFRNNPLVKSSYKVRFYAGVPLINSEGFRVGALCVLDMKPKSLTDVQKKSLESLGKITLDLLEAKRFKTQLNLLNQVCETVNCNIFSFNSRTWICEFANINALFNTNFMIDEILDKHFQELFTDISSNSLHEMINILIKNELPYFFFRTKLKDKTGELIPIEFYLTLRQFNSTPQIIVTAFLQSISSDLPTETTEQTIKPDDSDKLKVLIKKQKKVEQKHIGNQLDQALLNNEFLMYYQPITTLSTKQLSSCEALLRWRDPRGKISLPINFIQVAEESGRIIEISKWVIQEVARQIADWKKNGTTIVPVAINLSSHQLEQDNLIPMIQEVIRKENLAPGDLMFELTESSIVKNFSFASAKMQELKSLGFRLALDDFGTGYSSLSYLTKFPLDKIKIDKSFVFDITSSAHSSGIIKTIISLAKNLNLSVVAEGVETHDQLNFLTKFECDEVQGYLISKPISPLDLENNFLKKPNISLKK